MKMYWSAFLLIAVFLSLSGCGKEQFGTTPQSHSSQTNPLSVYQQSSCTGHTLIKPKVDILYVVDNSTSNYYISSSVKAGIQNTVNSISNQFDYRIIGTPLLETSGGNDDYQVLAKDPSTLPSIAAQKIISSSSQFSFWNNYVNGSLEPGLERVRSFIAAHQSDGLFRQNSYLFVVLVSNGFDTDIEAIINANGETGYAPNGASNFTARKNSLLQIKSYLNSQQFRLFSMVAHPGCTKSGWKPAIKSYIEMSKVLYQQPPYPQDQSGDLTPDSYNLCDGEVSTVFASVNNSIKQIIVPHSYKYWPITSTDGPIDTNPGKIKVFKSSPNSPPVPLTTGWTYLANPNYPGAIETRVDPTTGQPIAGEPTSRKHLIQFSQGNYVVYPDCISISTSSNLEYFGYIAIPKIPDLTSVIIKINGSQVPESGYTYLGLRNQNIKVSHNGYPDQPAVMREGYMFQLKPQYYYKSGDNVEIYYVPAQQ